MQNTTCTVDFSDVKPSEITFKQKLFSSRFSEIFLVDIRNRTCVMKVVWNCSIYLFFLTFEND